MLDKKVDQTRKILRIVYGAVPIVAGLDKFTNLLADWKSYLSPLVPLPVSAESFMMAVGVVEIAAGVLVLSRARWGAYVVAGWLAGIAVNLVTTGHFFDIAVRDLVMALGAFTLARLEEARASQASFDSAGAAHRLRSGRTEEEMVHSA